MSIRIALDNSPEFFTNLDFVHGRIILNLNRPENIGNIVVKLEGESRTALQLPSDFPGRHPADHGEMVTESHKLLYLVHQVYPDPGGVSSAVGATPGVLYPGQHEFRFKFKLPLNNICGNPRAMASLTGIGGIGSGGLFGGYRTMDGSKQLMLQHVKSTLPPSLTGFPRKAEVRYYIKVTVQRPGFLKENWRYQVGFKFLPVEPPRPPKTTQEAFARRPFAFEPRTPMQQAHKKNPFFGKKGSRNDTEGTDNGPSLPPAVEMSARLPHPSILTCNHPIPLRLIAKKLNASAEQVYLTSLEVSLLGFTDVRCYDLHNTEANRWVICSASSLSIPLGDPTDPVDNEFVVPDQIWADRRLPNTIAPSFTACNLSRRYEIEIKIGLSWGLPTKKASAPFPQMMYLPLKISKVDVYSGIMPPAELVRAASTRPQRPPQPSQHQQQQPPLPPRRPSQADSLYPPQLGPNNTPTPQYDDAPPSYDEAMAQELTAPVDRPAYSGVTAENSPSTVPEKSG